jgi:hypothetical protein
MLNEKKDKRLPIAKLLERKAVFFVMPALLLLAYAPALLHEYGWTDDFSAFFNTKSGINTLGWNIFNASGRPLLGIIVWIAFQLTETVGDFVYLRFIGMIGGILTAWVFYLIWRKSGLGRTLSSCFALLMVLTPAFTVYVGWTICFPYSFAAAISLYAGLVTWEKLGKFKSFYSLFGLILPFSLLFLAETIYQPVVGYFFFPALILSLREPVTKALLYRLVSICAVFCALLGTYYVAYKLSLHFWWEAHWIVQKRTGLTLNILERLILVLQKPLPDGLASWFIFLPKGEYAAIPVIGLLVVGVTILFYRKSQHILIWGLFFIAAFLLIHVPILMTKENYFPYRIFPPLHSMVMMGICLWCFLLSGWFKVSIIKKAPAVIAVILFSIMTHVMLKYNMAKPFEAEITSLQDAFFKSLPDEKPKEILFIMPQWNNRPDFYKFRPKMEYGVSPFSEPWAIKPYLNMLLIKEGIGTYTNPAVDVIPIPQTKHFGKGNLLTLDYGEIFLNGPTPLRPEKEIEESSNHRLLGKMEPLGAEWDWKYSPDLGYVKTHWGNAFEHTHLGKLPILQEENSGFWSEISGIGPCWIQPEIFPIIYSKTENTWLNLSFSFSGFTYTPMKKPMSDHRDDPI